jgi:hypothetical protein
MLLRSCSTCGMAAGRSLSQRGQLPPIRDTHLGKTYSIFP